MNYKYDNPQSLLRVILCQINRFENKPLREDIWHPRARSARGRSAYIPPYHDKGCYNGFIAYWQAVHGSYGSFSAYLRSGELECSKNRSILATHRSYGRDCIAYGIYRHYPSGKRLLDWQLLNIVE